MEIACITTYHPRECGIATFTSHLKQALMLCNKKGQDVDTYVVAMSDQNYNYPDDVKFTIAQDDQKDYLRAAKFINQTNANVCLLEHEFGIFGGKEGLYVLPLIYQLKIPLMVTFHTVLENPNYTQKIIIYEIAKRAERVVVMNPIAIDFLIDIYDVEKKKIVLIEHGTPEFEYDKREFYKNKLHFSDKKVLLTFGLINPNKGIETVLKALPSVIQKHPDLIYLILGKTHPNLIKTSGEEYRLYLKRSIKKYNIQDNVDFLNIFVDEDKLKEYLSCADIYITPYLNEAQITSGTLAYAVSAGAAVVSTPYLHARNILSNGRGRLFDFKDSAGLALVLNEFLDKPEIADELRKKAYTYGRHVIWSETGARYIELALDLIKFKRISPKDSESILASTMLPDFKFSHVKRMMDDTGIIQHAIFNIPNLKHGYCLDDNARALLMFAMAHRQYEDTTSLSMLIKTMSYTHYMQNEDGTFKNMMGFKREFLDEKGSEDAFGRAMWALGYQIHLLTGHSLVSLAEKMFIKAIPNITELKSVRGIANTIIGLSHYVLRYPEDKVMADALKEMADKLVKEYNATKDNDKDGEWKWFEDILTYDNGILPLSLFYAYRALKSEYLLAVAEESCQFLENILFKDNHLSIIGNRGWYEKGGKRAKFDQQPVDAMAAVLMFSQAYAATANRHYLNRMFSSFMWFMGDNDLRIPMYNFETDGCYDALESNGVNKNQGAESTISYMIAHLSILAACGKEEQDEHRSEIWE
ncbi:MAG: glycosyl transferase [Deltaproteobacteria bacterium]|nr:MAG: glycosyl transferase [Deltaproteobacteria bacterium]